MSIKTVYQIDTDGTYIGETIAQESPLEPGVWLMPPGSIEAPPPYFEAGHRAIWNGVWTIEQIPVPPGPDAPPQLSESEIRIGELSAYLASTDWYVIRQQETGKAVPDDILAQREAARIEISELRDGLTTVEA